MNCKLIKYFPRHSVLWRVAKRLRRPQTTNGAEQEIEDFCAAPAEVGTMPEVTDAIVVGGGIIGVCTAYFLAKQGRTVLLVERDHIGSGCSYANAGLITPSHAMPLPAPGVIKQACKWMLHEDSPLLFRPRLDWRLFTWLLRFASNCREDSVNRAIPVLRDLSRASLQLYEELLGSEGLSFDYERRGLLGVYTSEQGFSKGKHEADLLAKHGFAPKILDRTRVRELEPNLSEQVIGGTYYEEDAHGDCQQFVVGMSEAIKRLGVKIRTETQARRIIPNGNHCVTLTWEGGESRAEFLVLAAGSWTPQLIKGLGVRIPLQPGKGYSVTVDRPALSPKMPVMNAAKKVIVTPLGNRLRFAGTMEFAGLNNTLNETRANAVLRGGLEIIPQCGDLLNTQRWCGLRPCTPDGLPILDRIPQHPRVFICTGHAMLGYTLGPISGKLVAEKIASSPTSIDCHALRIDRF
jgi:D-amino-acid dehydrogenase